mmetsp:Transcript_23214/g.41938  ORF Transcript_23214/g.41938 Transcript_23214/m.41938 type:complete len:184 (-) Transcript_23214:128-679(-)|eukprot:CAMPEP_0198290638 /NCGR_PEP_ID=MMETSP1449-20131203/8428_1 /TAXON_ID=420275 /ORGANISM="Attheya septentrionalis, Strain CCMP2084" /LENGTH=183 /DNA_ID=CAMNT_0043989165 /DNA_START=184 /DNA_END=735 /DNA_ORIENTATION=+
MWSTAAASSHTTRSFMLRIGRSSPFQKCATALGEGGIQKHIVVANEFSVRWHGGPTADANAQVVKMTFRIPTGKGEHENKEVDAKVGTSLLQLAQANDIDLEGACEGVCACSTCHIILAEDLYDALPEASEDEEDMLDMAFGLTATSRLGCQITVTPEMDGQILEVPGATRNFYVDGHKPKPH